MRLPNATLTLVCALLGCAPTRQVPSAFPTGAAVNPEAPRAPVAPVGAVVRDEPPLPGTSDHDWAGLETSHAP